MRWTAAAWWGMALTVLVLAHPVYSAPVTQPLTSDIPQILQLVRDAKQRAELDWHNTVAGVKERYPYVNERSLNWEDLMKRYRIRGRGRSHIPLNRDRYPDLYTLFGWLKAVIPKDQPTGHIVNDYYFLRYLDLDKAIDKGGESSREVQMRFDDAKPPRSPEQAFAAFRDADNVLNKLIWSLPEYVVASNILAAEAADAKLIQSPALYELILPAARHAAQQDATATQADLLHVEVRSAWRFGVRDTALGVYPDGQQALLQRFADQYNQLLQKAQEDGSAHGMHWIDLRPFSLAARIGKVKNFDEYLDTLGTILHVHEEAKLKRSKAGLVQSGRGSSSQRSSAQAGSSASWQHDGPSGHTYLPVPLYFNEAHLPPQDHSAPMPVHHTVYRPRASIPNLQHGAPSWHSIPTVYRPRASIPTPQHGAPSWHASLTPNIYGNEANFPRDGIVPPQPAVYDWSGHLSGANAPRHASSSNSFYGHPTEPGLSLDLSLARHPSDQIDTNLQLGLGTHPTEAELRARNNRRGKARANEGEDFFRTPGW